MKSNHHCHLEPAALTESLCHWYGQGIGERLVHDLRKHLDAMLVQQFGYFALQIGSIALQHEFLERCAIKTHIHMDLIERNATVCGSPDALPFEPDSLDLILLMHSLDFAQDPHQVLREVERTLIPQGHVVIVGFNPWSLFGVWQLALRRRGRVPWCGHFYTNARVKDWLSLLGFESLRCSYIAHRPPVPYKRLYDRLAFVEGVRYIAPFTGGVYVLMAQKKVAKVTPLKTAWLPRRRVITGLAKPTAREGTNG
ncbi:MAG: class I SAM-dependent methyltransferase [Gammaproteobacteria bacterium]